MKVRQLIALLQGLEPEATVLLVFNRDYPFEYDVEGVAVRRDCADLDEEPSPIDDGARPGDVLLTQGAGRATALRQRRRLGCRAKGLKVRA